MIELRATAALALASLVLGGLTWTLLPRTQAPHPATPERHRMGGYTGSGACRSCHPSEHDSWSNTFHRTMTRRSAALPWNSDGAPTLPAILSLYGRDFHLSLEERTGAVLLRGPDLHAIGRKLSTLAAASNASSEWKTEKAKELFRAAPEVSRELVLATGSHHYIAFWIEGGDDAELRQLPFVYLLDEQRWLARNDAFLQPPDALPHVARWNSNCIQCHAVAGRPQQQEGTDALSGTFWESYDTSVAEEGISCEACHGPGEKHAAHYRSPMRRAQARHEQDVAHIFVPRPEEGALGSEVCGQCHSYFVPKRPEQWWTSGFSESFQAGQALADSRAVLRATPNDADSKAAARLINQKLSTIFWDDGSIMVGGREYNGLSESPCFVRGEGEKKLACTSCHSMHEGDPDQQIAPKVSGDRMCTQCHEDIPADHARHQPDSPGARCVSCHMPRTSYALLHGIPSHLISSPRADSLKPPNACTLCHVDRDRAWLSRELGAFSGAQDDVPPGKPSIPIAIERSLSGNAAERALYAYAFGTPEMRDTSGTIVADLVLPYLKQDPYAAVRLIAERSEKATENAETQRPSWGRAQNGSFAPLSRDELSKLIEARDTTPIVISE